MTAMVYGSTVAVPPISGSPEETGKMTVTGMMTDIATKIGIATSITTTKIKLWQLVPGL
jgi:hypothetical protein